MLCGFFFVCVVLILTLKFYEKYHLKVIFILEVSCIKKFRLNFQEPSLNGINTCDISLIEYDGVAPKWVGTLF